jgi:hypothetical protein
MTYLGWVVGLAIGCLAIYWMIDWKNKTKDKEE